RHAHPLPLHDALPILSLGETVFIGRSSRCAYSLKKTPRYLKDQDGERAAIRKSVEFRSVSRRHCRLSYSGPDRLEIENLSPNGTDRKSTRLNSSHQII